MLKSKKAATGLVAIGLPGAITFPIVRDLNPQQAISGKFAPPNGKTLLIVGQDLGSVDGCVDHVWAQPAGVTTYTDISGGSYSWLLYGLDSTVNCDSGDVNAQECLDLYPTSVLAIGLCLLDQSRSNLDHIANGTHDQAVDELGAFVQETDRPVYLRIGYEFDGEWNHYNPERFQAAYKHIVDRLRETGANSFATVWHSAAHGTGTVCMPIRLDETYPPDCGCGSVSTEVDTPAGSEEK